MTLFRIAALSLLLGSAVAGVVWFLWGAVENLMPRKKPADAPEPAKGEKPDKKTDTGKAA